MVILVHNLSFISIHAPREGGDQWDSVFVKDVY